MKAAFHTLGCKVNQYETEAMKEQFASRGFDIADEEAEADVYVINTCTVTNLADRKSRQYIRRMKRLSPEAVVAVTGCYSQVAPEELLDMPEVDIVTGNGEKGLLIDLVTDFLERKRSGQDPQKVQRVLPYDSLTEYRDRGIILSMEGRTRAFIKIQEGCDRFCSYCLIPFARGHVRSRDPEEVLEEAGALIAAGFREIVLTGINTALYGTEQGFNERYASFIESVSRGNGPEENAGLYGIEIIIRALDALPGDFRIRLSSLEPTVVNASYVDRLMKYSRLCHHLHLSMQSGSNKVIRAMNRHYTRDEYMDIVKVLRAYDPGYGITTDIIAGFPGEEEADFRDSLDMIERVRFLKVHAFKYSKRRGTRGEKLPDQIPGEVKNRRSDQLMEVGDKAAGEFMDSLIGTERTVIFEEPEGGVSECTEKTAGEAMLTGYADNYVKVYAKGSPDQLNRIIKVKLLGQYKDGMKGEIL